MDNKDKGNRGGDQFLTLRQASSNVSTSSTPSGEVDLRKAARAAAKLFGCYPRNEANDPETFLTAATAILASYPEIVADRVCDPLLRSSLPSKSKFLPSIAEIRTACETEMVWHDAVERRERERRHTAEVLAPAPPATDESRKRVRALADDVIAELNAKGEARKIDFRPPRSPGEAEAARRHFEARLPELAAEYAATPLKLGPSLCQANRSVEAIGVDSGAPADDNNEPTASKRAVR
jgi:hypothetical protein